VGGLKVTADRVLCGLVVASLLAGCSAGSGGSAAPPSPASTPTAPSRASSSAAITISIPRGGHESGARQRAFVSPSTDGVSVTVTHATGGVVDYDVTTNYNVSPGTSSTCAGTDPEVCTLQIPAPVAPRPDFDTFAFTLYDEAPGGEPPTFGKGAHVLGAGTSTASINANASNFIATYIDAIPASVAFSRRVLSGDGYLGFTLPVAFETLDVDLNPILSGTYDPLDQAVSIAVNAPIPPKGSTTLAIVPPDFSGDSPPPPQCNAAASGQQSVATCRSADAISVTFLQPANLPFDATYFSTITTASSGSVTNTTPLYISPIFVLDTTDPASASSGPTFTPGSSGVSPLLSLDGGTGTVQLSDPGARTQGTAASFTPNENSGCNGVIPSGGIAATSISGFKITGVAPPPAQSNTGCVITFKDTFGGTVLLDVVDGATGASPGISGK
jgi:hypothetical protein